jgi:hypothetical protein
LWGVIDFFLMMDILCNSRYVRQKIMRISLVYWKVWCRHC